MDRDIRWIRERTLDFEGIRLVSFPGGECMVSIIREMNEFSDECEVGKDERSVHQGRTHDEGK
jgi:hypothetical protein